MNNFIQYILQFDKFFLDKVQGATSHEISQLEKQTGQKLPLFYKKFLTLMGHNTGDLKIAWECNFNILYLLDIYEDQLGIPEKYIVIAYGGMTIEELYIECIEKEEDGPIFFLEEESNLPIIYADSLEKLLFRTVFIRYEWPLFPYKIDLNEGIKNKSTIEKLAIEKLGYHKQWFSDSVTFCGYKDNSAIIVSQFEGERCCVSISAKNIWEFLKVIFFMKLKSAF